MSDEKNQFCAKMDTETKLKLDSISKRSRRSNSATILFLIDQEFEKTNTCKHSSCVKGMDINEGGHCICYDEGISTAVEMFDLNPKITSYE